MADSKPYCEYLGDALDGAACDNPVAKVIHLRIDDQDEAFFCCFAHAAAFVEEETDRYERMEDYDPDVAYPGCAKSLRVGFDAGFRVLGKALLRSEQKRAKYKTADVISKKAIEKKTRNN